MNGGRQKSKWMCVCLCFCRIYLYGKICCDEFFFPVLFLFPISTRLVEFVKRLMCLMRKRRNMLDCFWDWQLMANLGIVIDVEHLKLRWKSIIELNRFITAHQTYFFFCHVDFCDSWKFVRLKSFIEMNWLNHRIASIVKEFFTSSKENSINHAPLILTQLNFKSSDFNQNSYFIHAEVGRKRNEMKCA